MKSSSPIRLANNAQSVRKKRAELFNAGIGASCALFLYSTPVLAQQAISLANSPLSGTTAIAPAIKRDSSSASANAITELTQGKSLIDVEFIETPVTDIVNVIKSAAGSEFDIVVTSDVDARLKSISLKNRTAEEAIRLVAQAANLTLNKADSRTYILSKGGYDKSESVNTPNPLLEAAKFLPAVGQLDESSVPNLAKIQSAEDDDSSTVYKTVAIRNVKPSMMAFWLDPTNHPKPVEFSSSDERLAQTASDFMAPRQLDFSEGKKNLNNPIQSFGGIASAYPQLNNPYAPYNPYIQSSPQFGGGNTGGGRQGGGRQGGNNNNNGGGGGGGGLNSAAGLIPLPNGVEALVAIDPQNALLVRGTEEGINEIRTIIAFLDRPIAQVEIEAQFVTLTRNDSKQFGIQVAYRTGDLIGDTPFENGGIGSFLPPGGTAPTPLVVGVTQGNFRAVFTSLSAQGRLKVIDSPRVTTFNNLTAQIRATTTDTVAIQDSIIVPGTGGVPPVIQPVTRLIQFRAGTILTVTPTVNQDGTITIAMQPLVSRNIPVAGSAFPQQSSQQVDTISNIRDGDTLAIGGLRSETQSNTTNKIPILGDLPLIGSLFRNKARVNNEQDLIIFVTARVVRRINEPVRGT